MEVHPSVLHFPAIQYLTDLNQNFKKYQSLSIFQPTSEWDEWARDLLFAFWTQFSVKLNLNL